MADPFQYDPDLDSGLSDAPVFDPLAPLMPGEDPSSFGENISASWQAMVDDNLFFTSIDRVRMGIDNIGAKRIAPEEAQKQLLDAGIPYSAPRHGLSQDEIDYIKWKHERRAARQDIFDRNQSTAAYLMGGAAYFGGTLAFDPITTGSAFIPVIREARYAAALAKFASPLGRAAVRVGAGAVEGAVGAAILAPLQADTANFLGEDYGVAGVFNDVFFSAALGAVGHSVLGAGYDFMTSPGSSARALARRLNLNQRAQILEDTIVRLENDLPPDIPGAVAEATGRNFDPRASLLDSDFGRAKMADAKAILDAAMLGTGLDDLVDEIVAMGGIRIKDSTGAVTREGYEVVEAIKDAVALRKRGLINNKTGLPIDKVTEALAEAGWLSSKDKGAVYPDEVYDLLREVAAGNQPIKKFSDGIEADGMAMQARKLAKRAGVRANTPNDEAVRRITEQLIEDAIETGEVDDLLVDMATRWEMANPSEPVPRAGDDVPFDMGAPVMRDIDGSPMQIEEIPVAFAPTTDQAAQLAQIEELTKVADEELSWLEEMGVATKEDRKFVDDIAKMTEANIDKVQAGWESVAACMVGEVV